MENESQKPSAIPPAVGLITSRNLVKIKQPTANRLQSPTAGHLQKSNPKGATATQSKWSIRILSILCIDVKAKPPGRTHPKEQ